MRLIISFFCNGSLVSKIYFDFKNIEDLLKYKSIMNVNEITLSKLVKGNVANNQFYVEVAIE